MHFDVSSFRIRCIFQDFQTGLGHSILFIGNIICPCQHYLAGGRKSTNVIHMLIRFIVEYSTGQPDNSGYAQVLSQSFLNLFLSHPGISPLAEQAILCHQTSAFSVHMNGTAFQDKIPFVVHIFLQKITEFPGTGIVLIPGKIKSVAKTSPRIEPPVHATDHAFLIFHKSGGIVPCPGVIAGHLHHANMLRKECSCIVILFFTGTDRHFLRACNRLHHLCKCFSGSIPSILPGVRTLRKN